MTDTFRTVRNYATSRFKEKGSKFFGHIYPVSGKDEAGERIQAVKKDYHDATHNCSAYQIGTGDSALFHYDDDGEPSGTAGKPIYQAVQGAEITNVVLIVTRYFGGTKLGTGGLIRAYNHSAKLTIDNAKVIEKTLAEPVHVQVKYDDINYVMRVIDGFNAQILRQDYGDQVEVEFAVPRSKVEEVRRQLTELTSGRIQFV